MSDKDSLDASDDGHSVEEKNVKKRKAETEIKSSPAKKPKNKTKQTTLITQAPTGPHKNYNEDITKILAGTWARFEFLLRARTVRRSCCLWCCGFIGITSYTTSARWSVIHDTRVFVPIAYTDAVCATKTELGETEKNRGLLYKWRAYNTAIQSLKNHDRRIESGDEAKSTFTSVV
jgi:hypothetical protein